MRGYCAYNRLITKILITVGQQKVAEVNRKLVGLSVCIVSARIETGIDASKKYFIG